MMLDSLILSIAVVIGLLSIPLAILATVLLFTLTRIEN
jgi:hypothetical protein